VVRRSIANGLTDKRPAKSACAHGRKAASDLRRWCIAFLVWSRNDVWIADVWIAVMFASLPRK
jgi:hypothetical protein